MHTRTKPQCDICPETRCRRGKRIWDLWDQRDLKSGISHVRGGKAELERRGSGEERGLELEPVRVPIGTHEGPAKGHSASIVHQRVGDGRHICAGREEHGINRVGCG